MNRVKVFGDLKAVFMATNQNVQSVCDVLQRHVTHRAKQLFSISDTKIMKET